MDNVKLDGGENALERCVFDCEKAVINRVLVRTGLKATKPSFSVDYKTGNLPSL